MKKIALIVAFMMLIPCTAFSMQMLNNSSMDQITGQSGVSIAFDDIQVFLNIERLAYIDSDGITTTSGYLQSTYTGAGGALYLNNFQIDVLNVNAIVGTAGVAADYNSGFGTTGSNSLHSATAGKINLFYDYTSTSKLGGDYLNGTAGEAGLNGLTGRFEAAALTIDVTDALPALTEGFRYNNGSAAFGSTVGGVIIGIPTMEVYINSLSLTPAYTGDIDGDTSTAVNNNKDYGTIEMVGLTFTTLSGWVEIAPH